MAKGQASFALMHNHVIHYGVRLWLQVPGRSTSVPCWRRLSWRT